MADAAITVIGPGANMVIQGGVHLDAGANFINDGDLHLTGDWINDSGGSGFQPASAGRVLLHGSSLQLIEGADATDFRHLVLSGADKRLEQHATCGTAAQPTGTLILDGGTLILNGHTFTLFDPAAAAVVDGGGGIRSESPDLTSRFQWALGNDILEHRIPFTDAANDPLPFAFTPSTAFPMNTLLTVATYATAADNTPYPITANDLVVHMAGVSTVDNSPNAADRFWSVDLPNGTFTGNLLLSYTAQDDPTFGPGPTRAQRWSEPLGTWQAPLPGQTNPFVRQVLVPNVVFADASTPGNEHIWALAYDSAPLPVTLISFNLWCGTDGRHISWSTASEQNSLQFLVERSADGALWVPVGGSEAVGQSAMPTHYDLVDRSTTTDIELIYRLWEQDSDDTMTLLAMSAAPACATSELNIYPNPTSDLVFVRLPSSSGTIISVRDAGGRIVHEGILNSPGAIVPLNVRPYASGVYQIVLRRLTGECFATGRFVKD
jgi:hypothetical protein